MLDTLDSTVTDVLTAIADRHGLYFDYADSYGEPGYGPSDLVVLGDYWCRCDKLAGDATFNDGTHLHDVMAHYPAIAQRLADLDVEFEWSDEWWNVYDGNTSRAYRCQGDSYSWQPSAMLDENGEFITIHDDFTEIVEWALNDSHRCIPANYGTTADLISAGFTQYEYEEQSAYESGWHPHQTDDPTAIADRISAELPDSDVVFYLDETSQFYVRFTAWTRPADSDSDSE